jgi:hypothetical protein
MQSAQSADNDPMGRLLASVGVLLGLCAACAAQGPSPEPELLQLPRTAAPVLPADPPPETDAFLRSVSQLKAECEALTAERDAAVHQVPVVPETEGAKTAQLRLKVGELLNKLDGKAGAAGSAPVAPTPPAQVADKGTEKPPAPQAVAEPAPKSPAADEARPLAPLDLAQTLFRIGDYVHALRAFRLVNQSGMTVEERAPLQYLIACCLRRLGKTDEAAALYREVANFHGDEAVAACAQWQLSQLRWKADFGSRLRELRQRRQALGGQP